MVTAVVAAVLGGLGTLAAATPASATSRAMAATSHAVRPAGTFSCSTGCYNVLNYGGNPDGTADNTVAFADAIAAAEAAGGGTVYAPPGTYAFTQVLVNTAPYSIKIPGPAPVYLTGAPGALDCQTTTCNTTRLVEEVAGQSLLEVGTFGGGTAANGSTVEHLTLDALTYGGGPDLSVFANDTVVTSDVVLGAQKNCIIGGGCQAPFAVEYKGPKGETIADPKYGYGNTISNTYIEDGIDNDGISFSYQSGAKFINITYFGSRLALYRDDGVTVTNFNYTPNPACMLAANAYFITAPSQNITIDGFYTSGQGGIIGGPQDNYYSQNITIEDETMSGASGSGSPLHLAVGNVEPVSGGNNGLTIDDSSLNGLYFNPTMTDTDMSIRDSSVSFVELEGYGTRGHYSQLNAEFEDDIFPTSTNHGPTFTEVNGPVGAGTLKVNSGLWNNQAFGFYRGDVGSPTKFVVTNLPPIESSLPVITGTPVVGDPLTGTSGIWQPGQSPYPTLAFQWNANGTAIPGATTKTFTPGTAQSGQTITVTVTATNPTSSTQATSLPVTEGA